MPKKNEKSLPISHEEKIIRFSKRVYGPGTFFDIGEQITHDGLARPTLGQIISLVHQTEQHDDPEHEDFYKELNSIFKNRQIWAFTANLAFPQSHTIYIEDDPVIFSGKVHMDQQALDRRLSEEDPSVRKIELHPEIRKHPQKWQLRQSPYFQYVVAAAGTEGAEKFAQLNDKNRMPATVRLPTSIGVPKVFAISHDWHGGSLVIDGNLDGVDRNSYSYGIFKEE
jgi:hypothetical protein